MIVIVADISEVEVVEDVFFLVRSYSMCDHSGELHSFENHVSIVVRKILVIEISCVVGKKIVLHCHPEVGVTVRSVQRISVVVKSCFSPVESKLALIAIVDVVSRIVVPVEGHTVRSC